MRQKNYGRSMSTQDEPEHMINGISQKKFWCNFLSFFSFIHIKYMNFLNFWHFWHFMQRLQHIKYNNIQHDIFENKFDSSFTINQKINSEQMWLWDRQLIHFFLRHIFKNVYVYFCNQYYSTIFLSTTYYSSKSNQRIYLFLIMAHLLFFQNY